MATPYVTPSMITNAPTGIAWDIIPFPQSTTADQFAEQFNMCWRATNVVDAYCNQVLRATIDTEYLSAPDYRVTTQTGNGIVRLIMQRSPVIEVLAMSVSPNTSFPRQWQTLPSTAFDVEMPVVGLYGTVAPSAAGEGGQSIIAQPGAIGWNLGRRGYRIATSYVNGWPHTSLTTDCNAGATTLQVDDVSGFSGVTAFIYDGSLTETVQVQSVTAVTNLTLPVSGLTVPAGPGTVTLASPTMYPHVGAINGTGTVLSSMPQDILWAAILCTASQALESGITSITIQNLPGSLTEGGHGISDLKMEYELLLDPYKRVI